MKMHETRKTRRDEKKSKKFVSKFLAPKVKRFTLWLTTTLIKPSKATKFIFVSNIKKPELKKVSNINCRTSSLQYLYSED